MLGEIIYALREKAQRSHTSEFGVPVDYSLYHKRLALEPSGDKMVSLVYEGVLIGHSSKPITAQTSGASIFPGGSRVSGEISDLARQLAEHEKFRIVPSIFWDEIIITSTGSVEEMSREIEYAAEALTK